MKNVAMPSKPAVCRRCRFSSMSRFAALAVAFLASTSFASDRLPGAMIEWPFVGSVQEHTKYSAADEITAADVGELEIAWQWEPNEKPLEEYGTRPGPARSRQRPL